MARRRVLRRRLLRCEGDFGELRLRRQASEKEFDQQIFELCGRRDNDDVVADA